jgi:hypothetical protein
MTLIDKLEFNRLIKELDFVDSDLVYKSNLLKIADENFIQNVNKVLEGFPQLKQILDDKSKTRIPNIIIHTNSPEDIKVEDDLEILTEDKNPKLKNLYREIAKSTHPDKNNQENLHEVYLSAQQAYESNDLVQILSICENLKIDYEITNEEVQLIREQIQTKRKRVEFLESTYTWKWHQEASDINRNNIILSYLEAQIK